MRVGGLPLVGREVELGVLERALGAVGAGRSWVVGLVGEPGIGKSRLLGELSDRSAERGIRPRLARAWSCWSACPRRRPCRRGPGGRG